MRAVAQDHYPVERQARFRAIPLDELVDGVTIAPLCVRGVKAVQHRGFGVFQVWQTKYGLGATARSSRGWLLLHDPWPPNHRSMIRAAPQLLGQGCPSLGSKALQSHLSDKPTIRTSGLLLVVIERVGDLAPIEICDAGLLSDCRQPESKVMRYILSQARL